MLALVKQKYPDATGNQLIQSAIRNTGKKDHDLAFDARADSVTASPGLHTFSKRPVTVPDENPLLANDYPQPSDAEIEAAASGIVVPARRPSRLPAGPAAPRSGMPRRRSPADMSWLLPIIVASWLSLSSRGRSSPSWL